MNERLATGMLNVGYFPIQLVTICFEYYKVFNSNVQNTQMKQHTYVVYLVDVFQSNSLGRHCTHYHVKMRL